MRCTCWALPQPPAEQLDWNRRALAAAEASSDARARGWAASLNHNIGWSYFDAGDPATALTYWKKALPLREAAGDPETIRVAKWTIARGYRATDKLDDAEKIQLALLAETEKSGEPDGYVYEELAEIAVARGNPAGAAPWAAKAYALLKDDAYLKANEAARLRRLSDLSRPCGQRQVNPAKRREIFERLRSLNPHPTTELAHLSPFELLVAVVLSAQATDKSVNKATARLFPVANTPAAMVKLGVDGLIPYINSIGLFRNKAKNVVALSEILVREHGGKVPDTRAALEALPGVGRKTANVVLNTAFGQPTIAVDTHIFRVANRTGLAPGKDVDEVERRLEKFVPDEFRQDAHHWLILHGRYTCVARGPKCPECAIRDLCEFRGKTRAPAPVSPLRN